MNTEVVSARLPGGYKARLERMLGGRSLAVWLREVVDGDEQVEALETEAERLADTVKRQREELQAVSATLQEQRAPLSQLDDVRRAGVEVDDLAAWSRVLASSRVKATDLAGELERCGSMGTAIKKLENRRAELETAVAELTRKQSEVERAITTTRNTTVKAISALRAKSLEEIGVLLDGLNKKVTCRSTVNGHMRLSRKC